MTIPTTRIGLVRGRAAGWQGAVLDVGAAVTIFLAGLVFRALFLARDYTPRDEGWLQSGASRIIRGQVPYRDFNLSIPPVALYKEAALQYLFGSGYTLLLSRWFFSVEVAIGSLLTYLILRRFVGPLPAAALALPGVFFAVLLYSFSNYTYDGSILALGSVACLLYAGRRRPLLVALGGGLAGLAALAKPNYLAFILVVAGIGVVGQIAERRGAIRRPALDGLRRWWPVFTLAASAILAAATVYFAAAGAAGQFLYQSLLLTTKAHPLPLSYLLWQDLPETQFQLPLVILYLLVGGLIVRAVTARTGSLRTLITASLLIGGLVLSPLGGLINTALGVLLLGTAAAAVVAVGRPVWFGSLPVELPVLGFSLQYLTQYSQSGARYSYIGSFLSLPVVLLLLFYLGSGATRRAADRRWAVVSPAIVGAAVAVSSIVLISSVDYSLWPPADVTARLNATTIGGLVATPRIQRQVDGLVAFVQANSNPGDPILIFADYPGIYFLADRPNATRQDWYWDWIITPEIVDTSVSELRLRPAKLVFIQRHSAFDPSLKVDYPTTKLAPLFDYVTHTYRKVGTIDDVDAWAPPTAGS